LLSDHGRKVEWLEDREPDFAEVRG